MNKISNGVKVNGYFLSFVVLPGGRVGLWRWVISVSGRPSNLENSTVRAYCACGWGCLSPIISFLLSPALCNTKSYVYANVYI